MRFGSVCSGIEAASIAFAPLGWEAAWLAEVDVAASQVLSHRLGATAPVFPLNGTEKAISRLKWGGRITNWGDMTRVAEMVRSGEAEAPDVLCGGTPCQSFSIAGLRRGLDDARGNLALAFIQLANAIDERRAAEGKEPCIVIFENVPGLQSSHDNAFGCFLAGLAGDGDALEPGPRPEPARSSAYWAWDKASGEHRAKWPDAGAAVGPQRAVGWRIGDAQWFGLAQRRRRIFVVASAREGFDPAAILLEFDGVRRDSAPSRETGQEVAGTLDARPDGGGFPGSDGAAQYHVVPHGLGSGRPDGSSRLTWPAEIAPTLNAHFGDKQGLEDQHVNQGCPLFVLSPVGSVGGNQGGDFVIRSVGFPEIVGSLACNTGPNGHDAGNFACNQAVDAGHLIPVQSVALRGRDGGATAELGGEAAYALRAAAGGGSDPYVLAPVTAFQTRGSNIDVDDHVTGTIGSNCDRASGSAPMIAFSCKDYGADATEDIAPTMRAMGHSGSHANAGGQLAVCVTGDVTHTLKAEGFDASEDGTGRGQPIVVDVCPTLRAGGNSTGGDRPPGTDVDTADSLVTYSTMAVRRLMPIECHYLQGFPGDWCAVPTGPKGDKIAADGPQYKQLGNSWAVNHARWVGYRIAAWLAANPPRSVIEMEFDENLLMWALAA